MEIWEETNSPGPFLPPYLCLFLSAFVTVFTILFPLACLSLVATWGGRIRPRLYHCKCAVHLYRLYSVAPGHISCYRADINYSHVLAAGGYGDGPASCLTEYSGGADFSFSVQKNSINLRQFLSNSEAQYGHELDWLHVTFVQIRLQISIISMLLLPHGNSNLSR